jgi:hypothetical protein
MTIDVILYSNLVGLSESTIDFLIDHEVTLVFKQNTLDEEKQDWLCGVKGTHKKIHYWSEEPCAKSTGRQKQRYIPCGKTTGSSTLLNVLIKKGYVFRLKNRLSVHTIACRQNLGEIPETWRKWRDDGILPQVQQISFFHPEEEYLTLATSPREGGLHRPLQNAFHAPSM